MPTPICSRSNPRRTWIRRRFGAYPLFSSPHFLDASHARRITPFLPCNDEELGPALAFVPPDIKRVFLNGTARALIPLVMAAEDPETHIYALAFVSPGQIR